MIMKDNSKTGQRPKQCTLSLLKKQHKSTSNKVMKYKIILYLNQGTIKLFKEHEMAQRCISGEP